MKSTYALFILAIALQSCNSLKVTTDYDRQTDFSRYKTYNFTPASDRMDVSELVKRRITTAVSRQMEAKGFTQSSNPDVLVDLMVKTQEKETATATTTNLGGSYGRRFRFGTGFSTTHIDVSTYVVGTLIVGIVDAAKSELVWEGTGSTTVTKSTTKDEEVDKAVTKIMSNFPPVKR